MKMLLEMHDLGTRNRTHGVLEQISPKSIFLTTFHVGDQSSPQPLATFGSKKYMTWQYFFKKKKEGKKNIGLRG